MIARLAVLAATIYAVLMVGAAPAWTVDDAWIVVRYAEHLAHTGTIAWNGGGPPVEGFTSLLSVLVAAAAIKVHVAPIAALRALGILGFVTTPSLLGLLGRALRVPPAATALVVILQVTIAEHAGHVTSGLETELFVALSLAVLVALARSSVWGVAVVGFLLVMTRPEGAAAAAFALVVLLRAQGRAALRPALVGFGLPNVLVVAWRLARFGVLLPNTFYAKRGTWNPIHVRGLAGLFADAYLDAWIVAAVVIACGALVFRQHASVYRRERTVALVAALSLAAQSLAYARSDLIMDYSRRFVMHDTAWLCALSLVLLAVAARHVRRLPRSLARAFAFAFLLGVAFSAIRGAVHWRTETRRARMYEATVQRVLPPLVAWIEANTPARATLAAYPDAGMVPYVTKRRTIDFGKLNDPYLAQRASSDQDVVEYFFTENPDVLVVSSPRAGVLYDPAADALVKDARFAARYELAINVRGDDGIAYLLYRRRP